MEQFHNIPQEERDEEREVSAEILEQIQKNEGPVYSELSEENRDALRETIRKVQEKNGL